MVKKKSSGKNPRTKAAPPSGALAPLSTTGKDGAQKDSAVAVQAKRKPGRPSLYSEAIVAEICERLSTGEPLAQICRDEHMPSLRVIYDWQASKPGVSASIARAREMGEDVIAAQVLEIVDAPPERVPTMHGSQVDSGDVANRKMRAEYRLKLLAKWNPKKWGDKVEVEQTGEVSHTIKFTRG